MNGTQKGPFTYADYVQVCKVIAWMWGIPEDRVTHEDCFSLLIGECEEGAATTLWPQPHGYAAMVADLARDRAKAEGGHI